MEKGVINLKDALNIFNLKDEFGEPVRFDITVRTFSRISKQGGRLKSYTNVFYLPPSNPDKEKELTIYNLFDPVKAAKDPNHFENRTRNLQLLDGSVRKICIDFIISINQQKVIY